MTIVQAPDPLDEQHLIELYESGLSAKECGAAFGRSAGWAKLHLKRLGITLRSTGEAVSLARREPFDAQRLIDLYDSRALRSAGKRSADP